MPNRDLYSDIKVVQLLPYSAPTTAPLSGMSDPIDLQGYDSVVLLCDVGAYGGTPGSDDFFWFIYITESDILGVNFSLPDSNDVQIPESSVVISPETASRTIKLGYVGSKRYIRTQLTLSWPSGSPHTTATSFSVTAILSKANQLPIS